MKHSEYRGYTIDYCKWTNQWSLHSATYTPLCAFPSEATVKQYVDNLERGDELRRQKYPDCASVNECTHTSAWWKEMVPCAVCGAPSSVDEAERLAAGKHDALDGHCYEGCPCLADEGEDAATLNTHPLGYCHRFAMGQTCVGCGDATNGNPITSGEAA